MNVIEVNEQTFPAVVLDSPLPVLVDFFGPACPPCKAMVPVLEEVAQELAERIKVVKVNAPENPALSGAYRVAAVPTFVLLKSGKQVARFVGFRSKERLLEALEEAA